MIIKVGDGWLVTMSLLLALLLVVTPLPSFWLFFRPEFCALLVIFWVTRKPQTLGVGFACLVGLGEDLVTGSTLGTHALSLSVVAYFSLLTYQRIRVFSLLQQVLWVFILVGISQLLSNWVNSLVAKPIADLRFLLPALTSALLWPWLSIWLQRDVEGSP